MTEAEPDDLAEDENVDLLELLSSEVWIGLTWAVDWIAFRGSPISQLDEKTYNARLYSAAKNIIKRLAQDETDLKPGEELPLAKGVWEGSDGPDTYAKDLVWSNASIDVDDYDQGYYVLDLTGSDVDDGSTGALVARGKSWHRIRVLSRFVLEEWPPAMAGSTRVEKPPHKRPHPRPPSDHSVEQKIRKFIGCCPPEIAPLSFVRMYKLLMDQFDQITHAQAERLYRLQRSDRIKPGPRRGPRRKGAEEIFEQFREKMRTH